jgi:hypothetical protein
MRILMRLALGLLAVVTTASAASADIQLTMRGGHVTLVANNVTVRQILAEWERVGQTKVINGDRVTGGLITLELRDMPERQALDIILRSVSGLILTPRAAVIENGSAFDHIIVMPPSVAPPPAQAAAPAPVFVQPPPFAQPSPFVQPPPFGQQQPGAVRDEDDQPRPTYPPQNQGGPVFVFPQPQSPVGGAIAQPAQAPPAFPTGAQGVPPPAVAFPGAPSSATPAGVSVPGMVVPAPKPLPGQPGFFQAPQPPPQQNQ